MYGKAIRQVPVDNPKAGPVVVLKDVLRSDHVQAERTRPAFLGRIGPLKARQADFQATLFRLLDWKLRRLSTVWKLARKLGKFWRSKES